ncbi:MAG: class I SAM-dependent methyltransferase [Christensenellales bacterium]|jgi:ubiquinone/menaquinone biosynthesis C-methylase UbiE
MDFDQLYQIKDDVELTKRTYELFNEDIRLNRSKAARVEFVTTVRYIEKYLRPAGRILDIGAGAGEYSLYFAEKGHEVWALELAESNIIAFKRKIKDGHSIELSQGNAVDLSRYADKSFDIVLIFGPLYHLRKEGDRQRCISEAKRVCRDDGFLLFSFISNDMVVVTELFHNEKYLSGDTYEPESFKVKDFPFVFFTVEQCRKMLADGGIGVIHEIACDGVSELLADKINAMDEENYSRYLRYHFHVCEKPEMLGRSNHLLFAGTK